MEKVLLINKVCRNCSTLITIPTLSDMAYGEYIATSLDNKVFLHFNALESEEWKRIESILYNLLSNKNEGYGLETKRFQWVIGKCMDSLDNAPLSIIERARCSACLSAELEEIKDSEGQVSEISKVRFNEFNKLTKVKQEELVLILWNKAMEIIN